METPQILPEEENHSLLERAAICAKFVIHRLKWAAVSFDTDGIGGEPVGARGNIYNSGRLSLREIKEQSAKTRQDASK